MCSANRNLHSTSLDVTAKYYGKILLFKSFVIRLTSCTYVKRLGSLPVKKELLKNCGGEYFSVKKSFRTKLNISFLLALVSFSSYIYLFVYVSSVKQREKLDNCSLQFCVTHHSTHILLSCNAYLQDIVGYVLLSCTDKLH